MGAGKSERSTLGQEPTIVQQVTKLLPYERVKRHEISAGHGASRGVGAAPDQVRQCHPQASPNPLDLVVDVAEKCSQVDERSLGLFTDLLAPVVCLNDVSVLYDDH